MPGKPANPPFTIRVADLAGLDNVQELIIDLYYGVRNPDMRLTLAQIGAMLGTTRQAVWQRRNRALRTIRRRRTGR